MNTFTDCNSERLYSQVLQMIDDVMYENRFKSKILLTGHCREVFLTLAKCNKVVNTILKSGFTDLFLIADQHPYGLLVSADTQFQLYPLKLKNEYERKQVQVLTRNQENIIGDDCDEHDAQQDFYTSNESQALRTLVPDENDLIKEKYSVYQLYDTEFLREILNAFFKMCKLSSQNKKLVNIGCYLTNSLEVTIEYKIDDSSLSIRESIKRRRLKEIVECVGQQFPRHQFDELLMQIVEQMFLIEEVWSRKNKDIVYNLCYYSEAHEYIVGTQQFIPNRHHQWGIFLIYPINFNLFKLYGKYKILILRDAYQLYFLNHEKIIMSQLIHVDDILVSDYHYFIQCNMERLEKLRQSTINKVQSVEQQVNRDLNKFQQLGQEMEDDTFITHRIEQYTAQMEELKKQLIPISQDMIDQQIEQNELQMQLQTLQQLQERQCQMRQEYNRVIKLIQHQLLTFKPSGSNHKDKQILTSAYNQMLVERIRCEQGLPIYAKKYEIMQLIKQNQVLLLIGETGSGKSTQLIQYLAEELLDENRKVICSQPRALAARQLSKRVSEELKCRIGDLVGYSLSTEHKISNNTRIVFTQDRILLNKLNDDPLLLDYDVVIVDEAHERTVNTDLLVGLLKKLLILRPKLKLIITSATLDEQLYCKYFNCPSFRVQGRQHQVQIKYCPYDENSYIDGVYSLVQHKIIRKVQKHTYKWMHALVFLAGVDEINLMVNRFRSDYSLEGVRFMGLHGSMSTEEQSEVFRESTQIIKVIFCTRIAETSITINDVTTVIDIGFDRVQTYDQSRGMQVTTLSMISQAQAAQRTGRAGRTRPGICYRLYSEHEYQAMESFKVPEIARCNLDLVVLRIKSFRNRVQDFQFLDKPNSDALIQSEKYLVQINALRSVESDTMITPLGRLMSQVQTEPKLSRILIQGYYRGVFQDVLAIIAVMLNNQSLYLKINDSQQVYNKLPLIDGSGDFMTFYQIYWGYKNLSTRLSNHLRKQWCIDNNLHYKTLKICESTYNDIEQSFRHFEKDLQVNNGIYNDLFKDSIVYDEDTDKHDAILRCFLSSYYPDICVYNGNPYVGYTMVKNHQVLRIYGTCSLSVLNSFPKYIICADLYSSQFDYCKVAQEVSEDLVKSIVPSDFLDQIKSTSQINPRYDYAELHNLPMSLLFQLIKAFPNQYADNRFCQYAAADMHMQTFRLWSEETINMQPQLDLYVDHCKQQSLTKVYGQRMIIFYTNGGSVNKIEFNIPLEYEIVEYTACPYNQYQLAEILKSEGLQYMYLFQHNITHRGYTGQIYFLNRKTARISSELLQQICQNNDNNNQQYNHYQRFLIQGKSLKQRMVSACAELVLFSTPNKGVGQIYFECESDADKFFNSYLSTFRINNKLINIMQGDQGTMKITSVPPEIDEIRLERQVNSMCDEKQIPRPRSCRLFPKDTYKPNQIDWQDMVKYLCDKYLNEWPVIIVYADKKDYKITVRISSVFNTMALEEMRRKLNDSTEIMQTTHSYMRTEYKIIKIVSKDQIKFLRREIDELIDNLQSKHANRVKVLIRLGDRLTATVSVIGQTPNLVRLVATTMHGLLSGLECKIKVQKPVLQQLQKQEVFRQGLWDIEQAHSCFFSMFALNRGKVIVHSIAANLEQIQKDVDNLINEQLATGQIIKLIGYSFKPLLRTRNNLMDQLSIKYEVELTLDINSKHIKMYGKLGQMDKCREELLSKLTKASDDANDCGICLGDIESKFILSICRHYYCQECIIQSIKANESFPINCPTDGCNQPICLLDMMNLMNGIDIDKILDKSFKRHKTQNPTLYIQCITPDCEELFQNVGQFFHCQSCLSNFCKECKNSVHQGLTCEEHKVNLAQTNQLTDEELKQLNIKRCPGCAHGITKSEGCNHMYCKQCECHFCWICGHQAREQDFIYAHIKEAHNNNLYN